MQKELELWRFIATRLDRGEDVMLLIVTESSGSSPGRQGYKMAVGADGGLSGSIGGGVMEVNLVEQSKRLLSEPGAVATGFPLDQVHRKDTPNSSGMICSGKQTVIVKLITPGDVGPVGSIIDALVARQPCVLEISSTQFSCSTTPSAEAAATPPIQEGTLKTPPKGGTQNALERSEIEFKYTEQLGFTNFLHIVGGGHCALALSEFMSKMDFHVSLYDDRPELNTIEKNQFAHVIKIVDSYDRISDHISSGGSAYVVVMTLGYETDERVIRGLIDKEFKYFGVLGSKAKMSAMLRSLQKDGISQSKLSLIRTPVGLPINSRTPEEIAVSIAAEIISVKNAG